MSSFNLNSLNQAFNFLNLQNILDSTIPSYFYFFNCLVSYLALISPKLPKYPKITKNSKNSQTSQISFPFIIS